MTATFIPKTRPVRRVQKEISPDEMPTSDLSDIAQTALEGKRLTPEQGLSLLTTPHTEALCRLADAVRAQRVGDEVYYASTLYIHPTNLCELSCPMCSFYAKPGWDKAWFNTPEQIEEKIRASHPEDLNEIHIVGGLWRDCDLDYYHDVFQRIKRIDPKLHIKAMTPVEYDFLAKLHGIAIEEVFEKMISWGLDSLPGGGAEILVEEIRKQVAPQKISSERFLEIHELVHRLGIPSNITMLWGHVEEPLHIITHLDKVRTLQDRTGGFRSFVPLKYHLENNPLGRRTKRLKAPLPLAHIYAVSRLMLDNFSHIKALWNYIGVDTALEMLHCGANDLSSTNRDEKIIRMAGGIELTMTRETMNSLILEEGRIPVEIASGAMPAAPVTL